MEQDYSLEPSTETEEEGLSRIEKKMSAEMEDAREQASYMTGRRY